MTDRYKHDARHAPAVHVSLVFSYGKRPIDRGVNTAMLRFGFPATMKPGPVQHLMPILLASLLLCSGAAQTTSPKSPGGKVGLRAYPRVAIGTQWEAEFVGTFASDGRFKPLTRFGRYVENMKTASVTDDPQQLNTNRFIGSDQPNAKKLRGPRVTPVVEDLKSTRHRVEIASAKPLPVELRDAVVKFVYGAEKIFATPQDVTTDSHQRAIITDPDAHAVHVLDPAGKASFSIVGGDGRRLQYPNGVAVDSDDNIYVSDRDLGMVLVYDPAGKFLRYIGTFKGENVFEAPGSIAIDGKAGRIYLLDPPRNLLLIFDMQGNELRRFGRTAQRDGGFASRKSTGGRGELTDPVGLALHDEQLLVLDGKSRLQIFGLDGAFKRQIDLAPGEASGLCVDSEGNIYVSKETTHTIDAYDWNGKLLGSFGRNGARPGEFSSPEGLWADSSNHLYVVDTNNLRLQMFQLRAPRPSAHPE